MPLNGSDVASKPAGTTFTPNTTIESADVNSVLDDIYAIFNSTRSIAKGFTGASTAQGALDNFFTGSTTVDDDGLLIADPVDNTKLVRIDAGNVTAGATRVLTMPDVNVTISAAAATVLDDASTSAMRTTLGVAIGSDVQAFDADLTAIAALAKTDGNFIVGNGSAWVAESGATVRTSLGLGSGDSPSFTSVSASGALFGGGATTFSPSTGTLSGVFGTTAAGTNVTLFAGTANIADIAFADGTTGDDRFRGLIRYSHVDNDFEFRTNAAIAMTLDASGNLVTTGFVTATNSFVGASDVILGTTGANTVFLRPNGASSSTGQMTVASTGAVTVNGTLTSTGALTVTGNSTINGTLTVTG